jgi:hypothetical protein
MVVGAIAPNAHEGSRSEYLAQYVFASFGAGPAKEHIKFALLARCDSVRRSLLTSARHGS